MTGGKGLTITDVNEAAKIITNSVHKDALKIWGAVIQDDMDEEIKITVIATGFDHHKQILPDDEFKVNSNEEDKDRESFIDIPFYLKKRLEQ